MTHSTGTLPALRIVVGAGGVGKTTLAAAMGVNSAEDGQDTLVMTFDPSLRLKDALGVGEEAREDEVIVPGDMKGRLAASLLDARHTFDRLIGRYAPDERARQRIVENRFYHHLAGNLAGILEYMAVERLYEVADEGRYDRVVLDTPPTRQALDFLDAPERIVSFLDSGALRIALKPWFDADGHLRATSKLGWLGRGVEGFFDRVVGLGLLRDMAEFFQAFGPLYEGFRQRALDVRELLLSPETSFILVAGPGEDGIPDTMFFARHLVERGYRLDRILVNRVHPDPEPAGDPSQEDEAMRLFRWLGRRDRLGLEHLRSLLPQQPPVAVPLLAEPPNDLASLSRLGALLGRAFDPAAPAS